MTHVHRTDVDGVPVFYAEGPPPLTGGLLFRVGQADETLTGRGVTHLIEHLALASITAEPARFNGRVATTFTEFTVEGDEEEVGAYFTAVTRELAELPFERLGVERRVLRTEDRRRGGSLGALAHGLRFGPAGYGLVDCPELGLPGATPASTDAWRRRWFTRGNAALWLSGPPPAGLDLTALPDGERVPPPPLEPYPYRLPAWYPGGDAYVAVSLVAPRSTALWAAHAVLEQRLYDRLRAEEGRSYEVSVGYDTLTAHDASVLVIADALPDEAEQVRDAVSVELGRLARQGPTGEELAELRLRRERATRDPRFGPSLADEAAFETLVGGGARVADDLDAELEALDASRAAAALREALASALWLVPPAVGMSDRRVHTLPGASERRVEGRAFHRPRGVVPELAGDVLLVGEQGVTEQRHDGPPVTVERHACKALQVYDDGARVLWGADSIRLLVHEGEWADGGEAIAAIDAVIGPSLRVEMGEPSGHEPQVDPPQAAPSGGLLRGWRRR